MQAQFPEVGEDIKVMGYRQGRHLTLTIALAFVDRFISHETHYFERKTAIRDELHRKLCDELQEIDQLDVEINTLDRRLTLLDLHLQARTRGVVSPR